VAALVDDGEGPEPASPRDVSPPPRMVSALRALQESRVVPPSEPVPDSPMGAYVPWGTWAEDLPARLRLVAQRCRGCGRTLYPPRGACPACRGAAFDDAALPRDAVVYAATRIGRGGAPSEFALEQMQAGAYWVGIVEWPGHGVRVTARLSGWDEEGPRVGDAARAVVRRLFEQEGRARYGVKFART
ncbi:MAG TPA: zinc ribbon domain-containing protein, partial [Candidatus Thermoplasmatota archaeon]|nr:zinc ribbon domain-containing protein [Candidatus Thermoplasmatota archaeon]